jgi:S-adenosylmethionine decarboxylase
VPEMARLELVAATKEARAPRVRTSAKTVRPHVAPVEAPVAANEDQQKDHFITRNGLTFAGSHLIIDLWEADGLGDRDLIEQALIDAVKEAGATLLHIHLHTFTDGGGISGVAVLAESHISVHTWPEKGYAAFDVFMCGDAEPDKALEVFKRAFNPGRIVVGKHKRGVQNLD